jgi:hypothetical protein
MIFLFEIFFLQIQIVYSRHQAAAVAVSTLQDTFDDEKEFCYMTDIDFVQLSQLF